MKVVAALVLVQLYAVACAQTPGPSPSGPVTPAASAAVTPAANPSRPTVTNPATIPPVGYLQFEQGVLQANASPGLERQFSLAGFVKLAVTPRLLVTLGSQPIAHTRLSPAKSSNDTGDLVLAIQALLTHEDESKTRRPTIALAFDRRLRTGNSPDLDVGSLTQGLQLLLGGHLFGLHYDTNYIVNQQTSGPVRRAQFGQTLLLTRQIKPTFALSGELWHFTQPLVSRTRSNTFSSRSNAVGLLGAMAYTLRPNLVLDAGVEHGLTSTSTDWQGFAGFTYLLPHRLWPSRAH